MIMELSTRKLEITLISFFMVLFSLLFQCLRGFNTVVIMKKVVCCLPELKFVRLCSARVSVVWLTGHVVPCLIGHVDSGNGFLSIELSIAQLKRQPPQLCFMEAIWIQEFCRGLGRPSADLFQPWKMSMTLQLAVARGTARGLINGTSAADYGDVISLRQLLLREGEHGLATDLLVLAKAMSPTPAELSEFGPAAWCLQSFPS